MVGKQKLPCPLSLLPKPTVQFSLLLFCSQRFLLLFHYHQSEIVRHNPQLLTCWRLFLLILDILLNAVHILETNSMLKNYLIGSSDFKKVLVGFLSKLIRKEILPSFNLQLSENMIESLFPSASTHLL